MTVTINQPIPDFSMDANDNKIIRLRDFQGQNIVLYFYPKDSTPGCTTESENFRDLYPQFLKSNTVILGVSKDSVHSHERFRAKSALPFDLLADTDEVLCKLFDVIKMKNMYGRQYLGIERSTFLIDAQGILKQEWRKVKVKGHAEQVLSTVKSL